MNLEWQSTKKFLSGRAKNLLNKKMKRNKTNSLFELVPFDCIEQIFLFIQPIDILRNIVLVNKEFHSIVNSKIFFYDYFDGLTKQKCMWSKDDLYNNYRKPLYSVMRISKAFCDFPWVTHYVKNKVIFGQAKYLPLISTLKEIETRIVQSIDNPKCFYSTQDRCNWITTFRTLTDGTSLYVKKRDASYVFMRWLNKLVFERLRFYKINKDWYKKWKEFFYNMSFYFDQVEEVDEIFNNLINGELH